MSQELQTAMRRVMGGAKVGDVFESIPEAEHERFKAWYVVEPTVPLERAGPSSLLTVDQARAAGATGDVCQNCQSTMMVRSGAGGCLKCLDCGAAGGCG